MRKTIFIFMMGFCPCSWSQVLQGVAKNGKGDIVYLERHTVETDKEGLNRIIRVVYTKPEGTPFASMTSDFKNHKLIPDTRFEDSRFDVTRIASLSGNIVEFEEIRNRKIVEKRTFPLNDSMVVGQGFDNFVRQNFDKLEKQHIEFVFGVLDNKDFYSLTAYKKNSTSAEKLEYGLKASSWFLRLIAGEIRVTYDLKSMKLKSFQGRSNLVDDSGRPQDVYIIYNWMDGV